MVEDKFKIPRSTIIRIATTTQQWYKKIQHHVSKEQTRLLVMLGMVCNTS
jgi:hypothetical protein